ncbi:hypothetical protein SFC76_11425 [Sphingomonas sp. CD22]|uniref:hypothetical protein n=1 Tax=Sphingomonas sp. CD22 TaxID=3100214 RepID=UPI002ADF4647|nr:hypothetical protein [Sphingomonas sp. CD22]MEA1084871.1 hypothetical protein [Sphingomonas sp. CD22]
MRGRTWVSLLLALTACRPSPPAPSPLVLWAWERPEDLRFARGRAEVAVESGSIVLDGEAVEARGRRFPLLVAEPPTTSVVHVEIRRDRPLVWNAAMRATTAAAILHYATRLPVRRVQVDFEVRASERAILLDILGDVRRALPGGTLLSMTALASWCGENWLAGAPVDEVVPMLFRMGRGGEDVRAMLAEGGDLRHDRCRGALGVAVGTPVPRAPPGRRVYLFDPRSWTPRDFAAVEQEVKRWR